MGSVSFVNSSRSLTEATPTTSAAWYRPDIDVIPAAAAELLGQYSHIPAENMKSHVIRVRDRAWQTTPYPCLGQWKFLELNMSVHPVYDEVVSRLKKDSKLLDLGCCFGQDIRKLIHDGVPAENLSGVDLSGQLIAAGYELFLDEETLRSRLFVADIFQHDSGLLKEMKGQVDIVFAGSFFHLFDWEQQSIVAKALVKLLEPVSNCMIFGHHMGSVHAGAYPHGLSSSNLIFKHDVASFRELWRQVGATTGTQWRVGATLELNQTSGFNKQGEWGDPDGRLMRFCVRREECAEIQSVGGLAIDQTL